MCAHADEATGTAPSIVALEIGPDGHTAVTEGATVDYRTGAVGPLPVPEYRDAVLAWSPDGERLFVAPGDAGAGLASSDGHGWISAPRVGQPPGGYVTAFSADGSLVASMDDGRVGLWDGRSGAFLGSAAAGDGGDGAVAFTPDAQTLVIAGLRGAVHHWDLRPSTWVQAACQMAGRDLTAEERSAYLPDDSSLSVCAG